MCIRDRLCTFLLMPPATHARVVWAVYLHRIGVTRRIIMSGSAVYSPWVEAKVMREYAVALGVPREDVLIEDRAEHSLSLIHI